MKHINMTGHSWDAPDEKMKRKDLPVNTDLEAMEKPDLVAALKRAEKRYDDLAAFTSTELTRVEKLLQEPESGTAHGGAGSMTRRMQANLALQSAIAAFIEAIGNPKN